LLERLKRRHYDPAPATGRRIGGRSYFMTFVEIGVDLNVTRCAPPRARPTFIHAAPRTSSTWIWSRFREPAGACCFYEPFNQVLAWLSRELVPKLDHNPSNSRHAPVESYCNEYISLMRRSGGARLFQPAMTTKWFVPEGGVRGHLRPSEKQYLGLLTRRAARARKVPVFGATRTLGQIAATKRAFYDILQKWMSFPLYNRENHRTFYVVDTVFREDDVFLEAVRDVHLDRANALNVLSAPLRWPSA
jgi:hypothetical protein